MASNGRLPASALSPIPGGRLRHDAARSWNAMRVHAAADGVTLRPLGSQSSYRDFAGQVFQRNSWCARGECSKAAIPGTSNHGWGIAVDVDLNQPSAFSWLQRNGARYGWSNAEGQRVDEDWHWTYLGGFKPKPNPLRFLGRLQRKAADTLLGRRRRRKAEARTGRGPKWRRLNRLVKNSVRKVRRLAKRASRPRVVRVLRRVLKDRNGRL